MFHQIDGGMKKKWRNNDKLGLYHILLWKLSKTMDLLHADQLNMQDDEKLCLYREANCYLINNWKRMGAYLVL